MAEFTPILYLKSSCPFCLKVAAFLSEAGVLASLSIREFWPGDEQEQALRDELAPHFGKITFPTLQYAPGRFMNESDAIIARYADDLGLNPQTMPFYQYVLRGPVRRMREQFSQIQSLNRELGREG